MRSEKTVHNRGRIWKSPILQWGETGVMDASVICYE